MERAPRVCATCKARKKRCDKTLPICGYCSHRGLNCSYEDSPPKDKVSQIWNEALIAYATRFAFHSETALATSSTTSLGLHDDLHNLLRYTLQDCDLTFPDVCDSYFTGFHQWLPIVSYDNLQRSLVSCQDNCPTAELSLLRLSMLLVVLRPLQGTSKKPSSPDVLYSELKMAFTRLQSALPTSLTAHIVQAGLILTAYEYACSKLNEAYISIGNCARTALLAGIEEVRYSQGIDTERLPLPKKDSEEQNIRWGIIFLEHLILFECPPNYQVLARSFPSSDALLPSDLCPYSSQANENLSNLHDSAVQDFHSTHVSNFGRQIQALYLLDQVIQTTSSSKPPSCCDLKYLDEKLRQFLVIIMRHTKERHQCGPSGTVMRSLMRLHQYILENSDPLDSEQSKSKLREYSHAALDTLARMMVDIAHDHLERLSPDQLDALPLTCSYNMRAMVEFIQNQQGIPADQKYRSGILLSMILSLN